MVTGKPTFRDMAKLRRGVLLEDGWTAPAKVRLIRSQGNRTVMEISIHEGRNRQIRRMCETIGYPVLQLIRTQIGFLKIGQLQPGQYRHLTIKEVKELKELVQAGPR